MKSNTENFDHVATQSSTHVAHAVSPVLTVENQRFGTRPVIFHHPGRIGPGSLNDIQEIVALKQLLFSLIAGGKQCGSFTDRKERMPLPIPSKGAGAEFDQGLSSELTVLFASNLKEAGSMPRCLDYFCVPYTILGGGITHWANVNKVSLIADYLSGVRTPYVAFFDCDDVFAIAHPRAVLESFKSAFNCKMLVMGGQVLWPPEFHQMPHREYSAFMESVLECAVSDHQYLNSGGWIARTDFARAFFDELQATEFPDFPLDDQPRFWMLYKKYYPELLIDYECKIFQCEFASEITVAGRKPSEALAAVQPNPIGE